MKHVYLDFKNRNLRLVLNFMKLIFCFKINQFDHKVNGGHLSLEWRE